MAQRQRAREEAAPGVGDISDAAPRLGSARHAQPSSIIRTAWVNNMSLGRAGLAIRLSNPDRLAFASDRAAGACRERAAPGLDKEMPGAALHTGLGPLGDAKPKVNPTPYRSAKRPLRAPRGYCLETRRHGMSPSGLPTGNKMLLRITV